MRDPSLSQHDLAAFNRDGFLLLERTLDDDVIVGLLGVIESTVSRDFDDPAFRAKRKAVFAIRNLFERIPEVRERIDDESLAVSLEPLFGRRPFITRAILFDKVAAANWSVPWHQDTTIAVEDRVDGATGFGPWSVKAGVVHVRPPREVLERMVTLRLHLDVTTAANGALRVIPGSHLAGFLHEDALPAAHSRDSVAVTCETPAGGAMLMRPLLLHASSPITDGASCHRRVIHLEFAVDSLPHGLRWAVV